MGLAAKAAPAFKDVIIGERYVVGGLVRWIVDNDPPHVLRVDRLLETARHRGGQSRNWISVRGDFAAGRSSPEADRSGERAIRPKWRRVVAAVNQKNVN